MVAFRKGLTTWANWVDADVDPTKTRVIFQGISPSHYVGADWGEPEVTNCSKEAEPINKRVNIPRWFATSSIGSERCVEQNKETCSSA
jgi:hypothetical protein